MMQRILHSACLDALRTLDSDSIDALVTDPPSGIAFMGKHWDRDLGGRDAWIATREKEFAEALRVLKPGAYGVVWALPRTSHWTATALENAGFIVRDVVHHLFGSGFPKSLDMSKAIDRELGKSDERKIVGLRPYTSDDIRSGNLINDHALRVQTTITAPATSEAEQWNGYGTALKPAVEHWILVQKPIRERTIAKNVLRWGTGALNIDATRIGYQNIQDRKRNDVKQPGMRESRSGFGGGMRTAMQESGRWPAHLVLTHSLWCVDGVCSDDCPVKRLGAQSGERAAEARPAVRNVSHFSHGSGTRDGQRIEMDSGTAARYFAQFSHDSDASDPLWHYFAKPSTRERNAGLSALPTKSAAERVMRKADSAGMQSPRAGAGRTSDAQNHHPTVKPVALMRYLIRLVTPTAQNAMPIVLDMFAGSGTTGVAAIAEDVDFVLIEGDFDNEGYIDIIAARVAWANRVHGREVSA